MYVYVRTTTYIRIYVHVYVRTYYTYVYTYTYSTPRDVMTDVKRPAVYIIVVSGCAKTQIDHALRLMASSPKSTVKVVDLPEFTMVVSRRFY